MAVTKTSFEWTASSSLTQTVPFEVIAAGDIDVYVEGVLQLQQNTTSTADATHPQVVSGEITQGTALTNYTVASNNGSITFNANLTVDDFVVIERTTDDTLLETFTSGSTVRARDLNSAFERVLFIAQEGVNIANEALAPSDDEDDALDAKGKRISNVADATDDDDAVNRAQLGKVITDDLIGGNGVTLTDVSGGTNSGKQTTISVPDGTASVKGLVKLSSTTPITTAYNSAGDVTLSIAADSIDLDRIKNSDIVTSSESNPNNDTTIATTAKIDDMIDAAITGDIAVSDGLSVTDDGDGTITLGISANSVDLDRLKNDDIITLAEQNAGPTTNDSSIFTSSAAAKRFDTLVQTGTPSGSYEVGKTWLQNDDDQTLKIWNGSAWLDVASGGAFRTQDKVIYVDATGGDDNKTGHRISGPKLTIKAAIADINADVDTSIESAGSGYTDGSYTNVPLTGGTSGSGLQANITVTSGAVTACTVTDTTTLEDYQIGDILSAADSNLGGGGGAGFELKVTGNGDGMTVIVAAGDYEEAAPIQIKRRNVSIIGMALRSTIVHPSAATQGDHADGNNALFELNSGSFLQHLTLTGMQAGTYSAGDPNVLDSDLPKRQGWNFAFYDNCVITKSPYIQNCTNFSDSQIVNNSNFDPHNPAGGQGGDLTNAPTGGGMLIDGSVPNSASPLRSMVADSYTHVGLNGPGILVTKNGYLQATSSYAFFNKYHIKALNGGQANLAASTTDFGEKGLVADGKSTSAIFTSNVDGAASASAITFNVNQPTAGTGWFGDTQRPAQNMLVEVTNTDATTSIYPILSATANTDSEGGAGWTVTISNPNTSNRSTNDGLEKALDDNAAVSFYLRSQIASSGHTMEYVGSGMDYDALPENGGVPDETKQITELNNGKVWTAITDHNGKFKIGGNQTDDPFFTVDQQLGFVTIPEGSIAFNLLSDLTPQLGGNLDVNGNEITSAASNNVVINPNGTGNIVLDANVGIGEITPLGNLHVKSGDSGASSVGASADEFVIEGSLNSGMTILSGSSSQGLINFADSGDVNVGSVLYDHGSNFMSFKTNDSEHLRIDSSGRLLRGLTSTSVNANTVLQGSSGGTTGSARLFLQRGNSPANAQALGSIFFADNSGNEGAIIDTARDGGTWTSGSSHPTRLVFSTTADGANSPTERLRIDSSGRLLVGTTTEGASSADNLTIADSGHAGMTIRSGSNHTGSIYFSDATSGNAEFDGEIAYNQPSQFMKFATAQTERMRIDSSGNVGIGRTPFTTASGYALQLRGTSTQTFLHLSTATHGDTHDDGMVVGSDNSSAYIVQRENNPLSIYTNNTERLRIDSAGNVGIGTTSPFSATGYGALTLSGSTGGVIALAEGSTRRFEIYGDNTNGLRVYDRTNTTERLRIDNSGRVGIGTSSPGSYSSSADELVVAGTSNPGITIAGSSGNTGTIMFADGTSGSEVYRGQIDYQHASDAMVFFTNGGSERMRIDSSGRLLVGKSSADLSNSKLEVTGGSNANFISILNETASDLDGNRYSKLFFRGTQSGGETSTLCSVQSGHDGTGDDQKGRITFHTNNGSNGDTPTERVRIDGLGRVGIGTTSAKDYYAQQLVVDTGSAAQSGITIVSDSTKQGMFAFARGNTGTNRYRGFLDYNHSNDSLAFGTDATERMRLDSGGRLLLDTTSNYDTNWKVSLNMVNTGGIIYRMDGNGNRQPATFINASSSVVGKIETSTTSTSYVTTSDYRLKENVVDIADGITRVKQLQPKRFNFIADADTTVDGFLAHEAQTVVPEAVTGRYDEVDDDGNAVMQCIDQSKLVPLLTAALQEAIAKIETLETKVAALEVG
jgi:hypothetical protein